MAGNKNSGRKKSSNVTAGVQATVDAAADHGAGYLLQVAKGNVRKPSWARLDAAKFAIEQKLGKAKTRISLPTDEQGRTLIPYSQIVILADKADQENLLQTVADENIIDSVSTEVEDNTKSPSLALVPVAQELITSKSGEAQE